MNRGDEFRSRFSQLLADYPSVDTAAMGFPLQWEDEPVWKGYPNDATPSEICAKKGHEPLYNHPSQPTKAICRRCRQKWIADYSGDILRDDIWKRVDSFEGDTRTDEELIAKWY